MNVHTREIVKNYIVMTVGVMLASVGISLFYVPCKVVSGGATGIATILYHTLNVPADISLTAINVLLFLLCLVVLGKQAVTSSLYGTLMVSVFTRVFSYVPQPTENILLAALFGGAFFGCGVGIVFSVGGTTGGTDIVGRLLQHKFKEAPIGKLMLAADGLIILSSFIVFNDTDLLLAGILALVVSSFAIDTVIARMNASKNVFVITDKGEEIAKTLVSSSKRGVTLLNAKGAYTDTAKNLLFCVMKENDLINFKKVVLQIDPDAFIVFCEAQKIIGNGFRLYK